MSEIFTGFRVPGFVIEREPLPEVARPARGMSILVPAVLRSASVREALQRGERSLADYIALLETGTDEDVWVYMMHRAALHRAASIKADAVAAWNWKYGGAGLAAMLRKANAMRGRGE